MDNCYIYNNLYIVSNTILILLQCAHVDKQGAKNNVFRTHSTLILSI